jgi:hypothetical protein
MFKPVNKTGPAVICGCPVHSAPSGAKSLQSSCQNVFSSVRSGNRPSTDSIPPPDHFNGHAAPDGAVSFLVMAFYKDVAPDGA